MNTDKQEGFAGPKDYTMMLHGQPSSPDTHTAQVVGNTDVSGGFRTTSGNADSGRS